MHLGNLYFLAKSKETREAKENIPHKKIIALRILVNWNSLVTSMKAIKVMMGDHNYLLLPVTLRLVVFITCNQLILIFLEFHVLKKWVASREVEK